MSSAQSEFVLETVRNTIPMVFNLGYAKTS
jgi:hypothetical protein